ncbi:MAG: Endo-1,4-beta-xylanase Z [Phycisphaerae bacterium]|nr:Endo-1,4-beta-xylanase Z [Phycisphaerae bacterium]
MSLPDNVTPIRAVAGGRLWATMFPSRTLDRRCNVFLYTPPGVGPGSPKLATLPVLYLLHGMWGSEIDWPFKGDAHNVLDREIAAGRVQPMIVAMPHDGLTDEGTFYVDWHGGRRERFERYMTGDLIRFVETELTGRRRGRSRRMIGGLSMGGFGALVLSLRNPRLYCAAGSLSGAVRPIGRPKRRSLGDAIFGPLDRDPASHRRQRDPGVLVDSLQRTRGLGLYLDCGRSDFLIAMNRKFDRQLTRLGIQHVYREYDGDHNWPCWHKRLPHLLRFLSGRLK